MDLLQYAFFQNALIGSLLTAIACGIVGTYIVSRRLVFISGGITHASFGGLGLGFYLRTNPILMAMLFSILSAFGVEWASKTQNVREDSAIAGVWSLGMALGVIFIFLTPGYAPNLSAYLFGNILTISTADILWILGLVVLLILIFSLFLREIVYVAFDRVYDDVLYCHDNCSFDPVGRDYAIDEFADLASNNGEPVYFRLQEDHVGKYRDRLSGLRVRTGSFLFPERAFRCVYHLVFGGPLFGLESNKTVVTALIKE